MWTPCHIYVTKMCKSCGNRVFSRKRRVVTAAKKSVFPEGDFRLKTGPARAKSGCSIKSLLLYLPRLIPPILPVSSPAVPPSLSPTLF